ncbi:hypothetical protein MBLNU230_g3436t1 [Neophaeotheca triangularis]
MKGAATLLLALTASSSCTEIITDFTPYVNLFLGTTEGGNMFPGVTPAPFSMVKLGPDVRSGDEDAYSGYLPQGQVFGYSMMHESGTGGAPKYGHIAQMPVVGAVDNPLVDVSTNRSVNDTAEVGYYKSSLVSGVDIELAATEHAAMYIYSFPEGENSVVVDLSHVLTSSRGFGWSQEYAGGSLRLVDGHYEGYGVYNNGWNIAPNWTVYFCGYFDQSPKSSRTFAGNGTTLYTYNGTAPTNGTYRQGGVFTFEDPHVTSRVGISFISTERACGYVQSEMPMSTTLDTLVSRAQDRWNDEVFSKITTNERNETVLTQLYSYLYGMHIIPSNRSGENPHWDPPEPYYDDVFVLWDLFRCSTALMHVLQPSAYEDQIRSLIDIWRYEGFMPDGRSSNFNGKTQGGSNADNVLADAYVKGVRGGIDWQDGYTAMRTNAEVVPPNNNDPMSPDASTKEGRGALPDWLEYGYITPRFNRAVSRAIEYSANDFGLYQVATGLNKSEDATRYLGRSRNWRNHWNPGQESLNFTGFVAPRYANGSFEDPYDTLQCGGCYWSDPFYQDTPWSYSLNAHHDIYKIIQLSGGRETFIKRLEKFFEPGIYEDNERFGSTLYDPGNQPSFTTPYLFNFAGRQDLSVKHSRHSAKSFFGAGRAGLPGNSDAGAMQTWILWNMIGLYPITGQTTFLIGSPWFEEMKVALADGKTLHITSTGGNAETAFYVQSLKVNGEDWDRAWVTWEDVFEHGGRLEFVLGSEPIVWATGKLPPSPASEDISLMK